MISHQLRCIFVHIPKTAGNSVNRAFNIEWQDHKDLARYAAELPPETFESYYKFAIVRNPWERILSDYNYQLKKSRPEASKLFVRRETGGRRHFREWLETALADPKRYPPAAWGGDVSPGIHRWSPQVDWITVGGRIAVDRVLRMEHLPEDFFAVCSALGLPQTRLPHRNRRFHWPYRWYYDDEARRLVEDYYQGDIEAFGYRFAGASRFLKPARQARPTGILVPSPIVSSQSP
jgi:hypothetical protein